VHLLVNSYNQACHKFSVMNWCKSMQGGGVTHLFQSTGKKKISRIHVIITILGFEDVLFVSPEIMENKCNLFYSAWGTMHNCTMSLWHSINDS